MLKKIAIELGHVQKTLLLPLWGRAVETQRPEPLLIDKTALEIINQIDYDFSTLTVKLSEISQKGWIARSLSIDQVTNCFLKKYPRATVVNLGCGLDTTFDRIDNGSVYWYDVDLPDVIELRRKFIRENDRRKFIVGSIFEDEWFQNLHIEDNILFIAAGVLYYFKSEDVQGVFKKIADHFPESEMIFDASSPLGIKMANKMVIKNSGWGEQSFLNWGLSDAQNLQLWDNRIEVLEEYPMFKNMKKEFKNKFWAFISDVFKMQYIVHLKFKNI